MHHAPCTMHHAPCTMRHAPCTMHHAPCTMHHAPCTMHHVRRAARVGKLAFANERIPVLQHPKAKRVLLLLASLCYMHTAQARPSRAGVMEKGLGCVPSSIDVMEKGWDVCRAALHGVKKHKVCTSGTAAHVRCPSSPHACSRLVPLTHRCPRKAHACPHLAPLTHRCPRKAHACPHLAPLTHRCPRKARGERSSGWPADKEVEPAYVSMPASSITLWMSALSWLRRPVRVPAGRAPKRDLC
eukprot:349929-Chlamydomonas_euryale.AAC.1